jgi:tetratricopeptide (TPR) repeat protein
MLLVLAFICAPLLCAQHSEAGQKAFNEGRMQDAVDAFSKVLADNKDDEQALAYRAAAYTALGKLNEAETDANAAIKLGTTSSLAYNTRGYLLWLRKDHAGAIEDYSAAIALAPAEDASGRARIHQNRGVAYQDSRQLDRALLDFNVCIALQPQAAEYLENRGLVYLEKSLFDVAYRDFDRAVELEPRNPRAYVNRAFAARSMDDFEQAVRDYSQALRLKADYAQALIGRGHTWLAWGRFEPARGDFEAATAVEGFKAAGLTGLGDAYFLQGRHNDALKHYMSAFEADRNLVPARRGITLALIALGRFTDADTYASELCAVAPNEARHWLALARVAAALGDHERTVIAATRALELDASSVAGRQMRGRAYALKGDSALAMADAQHLQHIDKAAGLIERARVNTLRGDTDAANRALDDLKQARDAGADLKPLKDDPDFKSLKDAPDFKKLTAD